MSYANKMRVRPAGVVDMDILGLQGHAPSFTRKEKEDDMYLEIDDPGVELADAIVRVLNEKVFPRMAHALAEHIELETEDEQEIRLERERRDATNRWMREMVARDLVYQEQQRLRLALGRPPAPFRVAPGGWL